MKYYNSDNDYFTDHINYLSIAIDMILEFYLQNEVKLAINSTGKFLLILYSKNMYFDFWTF